MIWMHCEGEKGKINLTVDEYTPNVSWGEPESRTGYVIAFSQAEYESIKDNLEETIVENGEIAYKYEQRNLLIGFTQKEVKEEPGNQSFIIKKAGWEEVSPTKTTNTSILELLQGNYFITVTLEASMDETGNMILGVTVPDVFKEDLIIVFKGTDMLFKKALVITPAN